MFSLADRTLEKQPTQENWSTSRGSYRNDNELWASLSADMNVKNFALGFIQFVAKSCCGLSDPLDGRVIIKILYRLMSKQKYEKNRSAMRTWGLMLNFIPFGWNAVLKYQHLGVDLLQVKR